MRSEGVSGYPHGAAEESQPSEQEDETEARKDFQSIQGDVVYRHHIEPRVQLHVPTETTFAFPLKHVDVTRSELFRFGHCTTKANLMIIGTATETYLSVYSVERDTSKGKNVVLGKTDKNSDDITSRSHIA